MRWPLWKSVPVGGGKRKQYLDKDIARKDGEGLLLAYQPRVTIIHFSFGARHEPNKRFPFPYLIKRNRSLIAAGGVAQFGECAEEKDNV